MDGLNAKFSGSVLDEFFIQDKYGSYIPQPDLIRREGILERVSRQLSADTGLWRRMTDVYYRADVEFTDNPLGNTPVLGAGYKLFGPRPYKGMKMKGRIDNLVEPDAGIRAQLDKREQKVRTYTEELISLHQSLKPEDKESSEMAVWLVEGDQALTGGGFDNNAVGDVHKSLMNYIISSQEPIDYQDSDISRIMVEIAVKIRDELARQGLKLGSLKPKGASKVRFDQDKDGMMGFPLYGRANIPLTKEVATRLLIETGIDTRNKVGTVVKDKNSGLSYEFRNIDALAFILDNKIFSVNDLNSLVTPLARIQKHGYVIEDGELSAKPGKARMVTSVSAMEGIIEAMIIDPFISLCQELKVSYFPSIQPKPERRQMIKSMVSSAWKEDYEMFPLDFSNFDGTVKGSIFATLMLLVVKPFYNSEFHEWFDRAVHIMTFRHYIMDDAISSMNAELYEETKRKADWSEQVYKNYTIISISNGLGSGLKITHIGGSIYGLASGHYYVAHRLGYEPKLGAQGGDDVLLAAPKTFLKDNAESTYKPFSQVLSELRMDVNVGKQMFHVVRQELVKVFLQEIHHYSTDTWGVGSTFRPAAALFVSEMNKGLSVAEQMIVQISRMNEGSGNPFEQDTVEFWLNKELFLGALFRDYGVSAFEMVIESIGDTVEQIAQRVDVGSFSWGTSVEDLRSGNLPVLPVMTNASSKIPLDVQVDQVLKTLDIQEREAKLELEEDDLYIDEIDGALSD